MKFSRLALFLEQIEATSSRLEMTKILSQLWAQLDAQEIWQTANLVQGQLRPPYEQLVFGLSEAMIHRALTSLAMGQGGLGATGLAVDLFGQVDEATLAEQIKKIYRRYGDWGQTVQDVHGQLFPTVEDVLDIDSVYHQLVDIALITGQGAQTDKITALVKLWSQVDSLSAKIISRIVIGKLRLGFSVMTMLDSLSWAVCGDKSEAKFLESLWQKKADVGLLAGSYLALGDLSPRERQQQLADSYHASVGIPIVPALCQRLNSSADIIDKVGPVIAEPKYDGMRVQIHLSKKDNDYKVSAFTRSLDDVSHMFPELQSLAATLNVDSVIFDSEAVGFDASTGKMLPFQETISRRRKHDIAAKSTQIQMKFFIFDVLLYNSQELLSTPLQKRKQLLSSLVSNNQWAQVTEWQRFADPEELRAFHHHQLQQGLEGMVAKGENSDYQSGRKGWHWVKIKEAEGTRGKLNDTLDLVIMGYYLGKGRRHEMGVGAVLAGVYDHHDQVLTISKIGSGFTDENLRHLKAQAADLQVATKPAFYQVDKNLEPDVWLQPQLVAEIAADELTRSSVHTSGYGLRFPRILRWREDKTADQATTLAELSQISIDKGESL